MELLHDTKINDLHAYIMEGQLGIARLCAKLYGQDFVFNHTNNIWHIYESGRWKPDLMQQVRKYVIDGVYRLVYAELDRVQKMHDNADKEEKKVIKPYLDEVQQLVKSLTYKTYINAVLDLLSSELPTHEGMFDVNPYLFICGNGVYNLKTKEFTEHVPSYMISKAPSTDYIEGQECPQWIEFIDKIFCGNKPLIDYVQKAVGLSFSGLSDFQGFFFCFGSGANGKSTFFNVLKILLQDYYANIPIDSLLSKNQQSNDYHIASLKGSRLVVSSEIPEGKSLNESLIKDLTGGDTITARHIYGKPFQFTPTHKLWMFGNHKPIIKGDDHGIWRRVYLIPFEYKFTDESKRPMDEIMSGFKAELGGILNWCIDGFHRYTESGLQAPETVEQHIQEYKKEVNSIAGWFDLRMEQIPHDAFQLSSDYSQLFGDYEDYCQQTGAYQLSRIKFSRFLETRGIQIAASKGNKRAVMGWRLRDSAGDLANYEAPLPF
jgi:putative DNA primase/helicase